MKTRLVSALVSAGCVISLLPSANAASTTTIVAVGDIARSGGGQVQTAKLAKNLAPDKLILMGDLAYDKGSNFEFDNYLLPSWQPLLTKSYAVPGNHEYRTSNAAGYRKIVQDFQLPKTGNDLWWVKRIDGWTVIGLDSEKMQGSTGTRQLNFLKTSLTSNNGRPTIVTWHRPRYSRGDHGNQTDTDKIWDTVKADRDVKLVLWGHDHNYERVNRTIYKGKTNQRKLTTIVVGTGGAKLRTCPSAANYGKLICGPNNYGVLKLTLRDKSVSWEYRQVDGSQTGKVRDTGTVTFNY